MRKVTFSIGGIHPADSKLTRDCAIETLPLPQTAYVSMAQHLGAPATPIVAVGDKVKVGQVIAEPAGFISAFVHSPVSGTVKSIAPRADLAGKMVPHIEIAVEGDEWAEGIDLTSDLVTAIPDDREFILARVKNNGVVGLGGATFPTHVKLNPAPGSKAECLILNGAECEPYLTSDFRILLERTKEIVVGAALMQKVLGGCKTVIGIEENKPEAIAAVEKALAELPFSGITVLPLKKRYPQGGEKQLVEAVTGRQVPMPPAIPINVGAVVQNVATSFAVYEAVMKHKPLFERYVTVTGKRVEKPGNFVVRMGTSAADILDLCGGLPACDNKVLSGGPMMGKALVSLEAPVVKGTNCLTVLSDDEARREKPSPCIRCAKCVAACPMGLEPYLLATLSSLHNWERAENEDIFACIECGSCQYTCPSHRPLLDNIRIGKATVIGIMKSRKKG